MVLAWLIRAEVFVRVCEPGMGCVVYTGGGRCRGLGREGVHARVRKFVYVQACMFVYVYVDVQSMCTCVHPCSYMYAYLHVFINSFHILCLSPALLPPTSKVLFLRSHQQRSQTAINPAYTITE